MKMSLLALVLSLPLTALAQAPAAKPAPAAPAAAPAATPTPAETQATAVKALEKQAMAEKADIIAKNMGLNAEQAATFWPVYQKYQDGFSALFAQQLELISKYAASYEKLDDAGAVALMNGQLDRDTKVAAYRTTWFPEFQKVLPGKLATKFMQIDRRLSLLTQLAIASQVPVVQ